MRPGNKAGDPSAVRHILWSALTRQAAALAFVGAAFAIRYSLSPLFGANAPYLQFFPAVLLASWYGGFAAGITATLASAASISWFLPPDGMAIGSLADGISLAFFIAIGAAIATINGRLRVARDRARHDAALATSRAERLAAIINTSVDGIIVIDRSGIVEAFNPGAERLFGYSAADVIGQNVSVLMPSPFREQHDGYLERYQKSGKAAIIGVGREVRGRRRDGSTFPLHLSVGEMTVDGQPKYTGMLHDLSDRVDLEHRLRTSEAKWRAVIDSAIVGIVVIDSRGTIEALNPAAERLFGYSEAEALGKNVKLLMPSPYHEEHDSYLSRYVSTGERRIIGTGREVTGRRKDGTTFPLHLSVGEMLMDGERRFTGILHDLTARVALEARLRDQTALARLGEMAAVLAHEIKNPLAGIRGVVQVIGGRLPAGSDDAKMMKEIVQRVDSLDALMKDLLVFARPPKPKLAPVDVPALLNSTASLLKADQSAGAVEVHIEGSAPPVPADPDMLKMVFQNLLINGAHAMNGSGTIRVAVANHGSTCRIEVKDGGPGIPPEIREKVFVPFFTTKRRGTGLGLPTAKRFIEAHHGQMSIECPPSGGTAVIIHLPLAAAEAHERH